MTREPGAMETKSGGLPTRPGTVSSASTTRPSPTSSATRSETVTLVSPLARARSARLAGP